MKPSSLSGIRFCTVLILAACGSADKQPTARDSGVEPGPSATDSGSSTKAGTPTISVDSMPSGSYCALPGSYVHTDKGMAVVAGGDPSSPDLSWLSVPTGYCLHHYAHVAETRQLRVASNGDVFVASPSKSTAGSDST